MSEHDLPADLDTQAHRPGCPHYGEDGPVPLADRTAGYLDLFCECHDWAEPLVLGNESDVAWPAGWNEKMASEWRHKCGPQGPLGQGQAG